MTSRLTGKTALVTAAGTGIGRAIAIAFAQEGAHVVATNRSGDKLKDLAEHGVAEVHELDVTDRAGIKALAASTERLECLVNCAGIVQPNTVLSCTDEALAEAMDINVYGAVRMIQSFMPIMLTGEGGSIVNIGSIISSLKGAPERFAYGTTKGALNGLTKSISNDFAPKGIRINTICPGTIETESMNARINAAPDPDEARAMYSARHPVGRLGRPQDVAALAVHLASDEAGFMTGETITLDGGWTA